MAEAERDATFLVAARREVWRRKTQLRGLFDVLNDQATHMTHSMGWLHQIDENL